MSMLRIFALCATIATLWPWCNCSSAFAQRPATASGAEEAIQQAGQAYLAAIEKGDPEAIASFWTPEGTYTDEDGQTYKSRELIQKSFSAKQELHPDVQVTGVETRFLTPDVAMQEGTSRLKKK
ncbi:MAG: SgcJ/EcaC family oxidoreductase, partial [Pirellulales bacterium]|nr:SgcJ/EcaC family oxidoreductase [Pirellulales bacterium]